MSEEFDTLKRTITEKLDALGQPVSEDKINEMIGAATDPILAEIKAMSERKARFVDGKERELAVRETRYGQFDLGANDVEYLHDLMVDTNSRGLSKGPSEQLRNLHKDINTRAMDTAESGYGSQLIGAQYISELWEGARQQSVVFARIPSFQMNAPTAYLPVAAAPPEMLYVSENTSSDSSNYTTSKTGSNRVTVSAKKFIIHQMWSGEMEEDSIIPYVPFLRAQAAWSLGFYSDSAVLNGDTTNAGTGNINLDDADPDDTKHYLAFDGIRHVGLVDNTGNQKDQSGAVTYDDLIGLRTDLIDRTYKMDWGHPTNPTDLVYVCTPEDGDQIALMDEVVTVDKMGSAATVLTGQVANIGRHPLLSTIALPLTEADGFVSTTAGNNTKGQVVLFNRNGFVVGWRRMAKIETERLPATDQTRIVYSLRMGFGRFSPTGAAAGIEAATVMYDITI